MPSRIHIRVLLALAVALLFVVAFAYQASAFSAGGSAPWTYTGTIIAYDKDSGYLTVQSAQNEELSFTLDHGAPLIMCNAEPISDLNIGDHVKVSYFEEGTGGYIASQVVALPFDMNHC